MKGIVQNSGKKSIVWTVHADDTMHVVDYLIF